MRLRKVHHTTRPSVAITFSALADALLIDALVQCCPEFDLNLLKLGGSFGSKGLTSIDVASLVCTIEAALHARVRDEDYEFCASVEGARRVIEDILKQSRVTLINGDQGIAGLRKNDDLATKAWLYARLKRFTGKQDGSSWILLLRR